MGDKIVKNLKELGEAVKEAGISVSGMPSLAGIGDFAGVDVTRAKIEAEKRKNYAEEMGRKKAHAENVVAMLDGLVLAPIDKEKLERAKEAITKIAEYMKGLDKTLLEHVDLSYLIETIKLETERVITTKKAHSKMPEKFLQAAVNFKRARFHNDEEKKNAAKGKAPSNTIFWNGKGYVPIAETLGNKALFAELRKLCKAVGELVKEEKIGHAEEMKARGVVSLIEAVDEEKEGITYVYMPPVRFADGKTISEGHLVLKLFKGEKGSKFFILDAEGRNSFRYMKMAKDGTYLPFAYVRVGKITGHIKDKDLFEDMRIILRDVLCAIKHQQEKKAVSASDTGEFEVEVPIEAGAE